MTRSTENREDPINRQKIENNISFLKNNVNDILQSLLNGKKVQIEKIAHISKHGLRGGNAFRRIVNALSTVNPHGRRGIKINDGNLEISLQQDAIAGITQTMLEFSTRQLAVETDEQHEQREDPRLKRHIRKENRPNVYIPKAIENSIIRRDSNTPDIVFASKFEMTYISDRERMNLIEDRIKRAETKIGAAYSMDDIVEILYRQKSTKQSDLDRINELLNKRAGELKRDLTELDDAIKDFSSMLNNLWETDDIDDALKSNDIFNFDCRNPDDDEDLNERAQIGQFILEKYAQVFNEYEREKHATAKQMQRISAVKEESLRNIKAYYFVNITGIEIYMPLGNGKLSDYVEALFDLSMPKGYDKERTSTGLTYKTPKDGKLNLENLKRSVDKNFKYLKEGLNIGLEVVDLGNANKIDLSKEKASA